MRNVLLQPIHGGTLFTQDELLYTQTYPDYTSMDSAFNTANPLVQNDASTSNSRSRLFSVNAGLEFDFLKYFTYRVAGSYTWSNSKSTSFADENSTSYIMDPENTGINGSIANKESYKYQITNTLNYNQTFAQKHKVNVLLGHEVTYSESEDNSMKLRKFPYPNHGLDQIDQAEVYEKMLVTHIAVWFLPSFVPTIRSMNVTYLQPLYVEMDPVNLLQQINGEYSLLFQPHGVFRKKPFGKDIK